MAIFEPVYRPSRQQQPFLLRQHRKGSKKRKRDDDSDEDDADQTRQGSQPSSPEPRPQELFHHPIDRKDPYFIAGISREDILPPPPFPHAAAKESRKPKQSIEEQLATLNPPLCIPSSTRAEDTSSSFKRRHLDNLTTILHTSMQKGDWTRAARAWSIIVRTEVNGLPIDIRRHGRWGIGAELLMRQNVGVEMFSDEGFRLAKDFYERLILQYPHTAHSQHGFNATVVYPALFNIWIYEVQDRSKRLRHKLRQSAAQSDVDSDEDTSDLIDETEHRKIRIKELDEALPIAQRLDELLLAPPYDTDTRLLEIRGMVALWITDLRLDAAKSPPNNVDNSFESEISTMIAEDHSTAAQNSRQKAHDIFTKLQRRDVNLPDSIKRFLNNYHLATLVLDEDEDTEHESGQKAEDEVSY
jgi:hypothetical protein